ncbi:MAG: hypothetical protein JXB32_14285 [Deltaproteobacteria bacterium]|nr:hypothetical protein [Deltaproteobacteria bacterium]
MPGKAPKGGAKRLLLVEFAATDRFHRALLFPFVLGYARSAGRPARWLRFGVPAAAPAGVEGGGVPLPREDEARLRAAARAFRPDLVLFNMTPSPGVRRAAAAAGRTEEAVLTDGGTGAADTGDVPQLDLARTSLDAVLGRRDAAVQGTGLFQNVEPHYGLEAANEAAETMDPLPFVFLGEECTYNRPFRASAFLAGLTFEGCFRKGGCSFCGRPEAGRWTTPPPELLRRQLAAIDRTLPGTEGRGLRIRLLGEAALRHVGAVAREALRFGRRPLGLLLDSRVDHFLAAAEPLRRALRALDGSGVRLELSLLGAESFGTAALDRLNKGLRPEQTLRAVRLLFDLEREFPAGFGFREHGGLSMITMTPWTTPAELALDLAVVGALGLEGIVGKLFTGRLRLFRGLPLVEAARRDGLLVRRYADPLLDTARRNLYETEIPWRFARPEMESLCRILVRLDADVAAASDPLSRRVAKKKGTLGRGVTARSVAAALAMTDAAMLAAASGKRLAPAALLRAAEHGTGAARTSRAAKASAPPRHEAWVRHAEWRGGADDRGRLPLPVLLAHKPAIKVEPLTATECDRFRRDPELPNVRARRRGSRAGGEAWEVFVGRRSRDVAAAVELAERIERARPGPELRDAVTRMGIALGYPKCCARGFSQERPPLVDNVFWLHVARRVAVPGRVPPEMNPLAPWLEYVPCSAACRASVARARSMIRAWGAEGRRQLERCRHPVLLFREVQGQAVELVPRDEPGERFRYRAGVVGGSGPLVEAVCRGDELVLEDERTLVLRRGRPLIGLSARAFLWWHERALQAEFWRGMVDVLRARGPERRLPATPEPRAETPFTRDTAGLLGKLQRRRPRFAGFALDSWGTTGPECVRVVLVERGDRVELDLFPRRPGAPAFLEAGAFRLTYPTTHPLDSPARLAAARAFAAALAGAKLADHDDDHVGRPRMLPDDDHDHDDDHVGERGRR